MGDSLAIGYCSFWPVMTFLGERPGTLPLDKTACLIIQGYVKVLIATFNDSDKHGTELRTNEIGSSFSFYLPSLLFPAPK